MNKIITIFLINFLFLPLVLSADVFEETKNSYDRNIRQWINEEKTDEIFLRDLSALENDLESSRQSKNKYYWLSTIKLMIGFVHFINEDVDESLLFLEDAKELAEESLKSGGFSDGWRVLSEAGSYIMLQKGVGYIIANSGKVQEQAEKSLELDPLNSRAALIVAQGMLNAPAIFGGNKKKGIEQLESLSMRNSLSFEDRYFIMMALSDAYINLKRNNDAIRNYRMMLSIYPDNSYIKKKMEELL